MGKPCFPVDVALKPIDNCNIACINYYQLVLPRSYVAVFPSTPPPSKLPARLFCGNLVYPCPVSKHAQTIQCNVDLLNHLFIYGQFITPPSRTKSRETRALQTHSGVRQRGERMRCTEWLHRSNRVPRRNTTACTIMSLHYGITLYVLDRFAYIDTISTLFNPPSDL